MDYGADGRRQKQTLFVTGGDTTSRTHTKCIRIHDQNRGGDCLWRVRERSLCTTEQASQPSGRRDEAREGCSSECVGSALIRPRHRGRASEERGSEDRHRHTVICLTWTLTNTSVVKHPAPITAATRVHLVHRWPRENPITRPPRGSTAVGPALSSIPPSRETALVLCDKSPDW
jgi:hypothetical protein